MAELSIDYLENSVHQDLNELDELLHSLYIVRSQLQSLKQRFREEHQRAEDLANALNLKIIWATGDHKPKLTRKYL